MHQRQMADLVLDRSKWPRILYSQAGAARIDQRVLELARKLRWQLVRVPARDSVPPVGVVPQGAILRPLPNSPLVKGLLEQGCPVVRIGRFPHPQDNRVPAVMADITTVGCMAAEHFAQRGFRHVGYVGRSPWSDYKALYDGLVARAETLGMACHLLQLKSGLPTDAEEKKRIQKAEFTRWLREVPKPLGLLGFSDTMAVRLCRWGLQAGVDVPRDVAVLGQGNDEFICESAQVPLSSIAPNHRRTAEVAVETLQQLMRGERPPETTIQLPARTVIVRESTDVLAAHNPVVVRALRYMWDHISLCLGVADIARAVGVSRRTLERAFREDVGRGVNQELLRRRIEQSCELLKETDLTIADVAPAVGFGSKDYFQRAFRKAMGTTPGQWRRKQRARGEGGE